jgi:signal transduction histidine kinase
MSGENEIFFSVDAGIIDRLGRELVSRAETAVSELIKNCYDADSKSVDVEFIDSRYLGGKLIIEDSGLGMNYTQLVNGFMRLSSTDKVHNPYSERYKRLRAGKKGIGRFATQRLGAKLSIITQTKEATDAFELIINWGDYEIDKDLHKIKNTLNTVPKTKEEGTTIVIEGLKDIWDESAIKKVYRHISELIQPEYLSENAKTLNTANKVNGSFEIKIYKTIDGEKVLIADDLSLVFNRSLAIIEGFIDNEGDGFCGVKSDSLGLDDYALEVFNERKKKKKNEAKPQKGESDDAIEEDKSKDSGKFHNAKNVYFKLYYFIYKKLEYYKDLKKADLNAVEKISKTAAGIKLYRNGFRVSPYGDPGDDWLHLDSSYFFQTGVQNIPLSNQNFFGFVEIVDTEGHMFEETASREGLLHNGAYNELVYFISKAIATVRNRLAEKVNIIREKEKNKNKDKSVEEQIDELEGQVATLTVEGQEIDPKLKEKIALLKGAIAKIREGTIGLIEEIGMLRILSAMGLLIGEFSHEITQYTPSIRGYMTAISSQIKNNEDPSENLVSLNTLLTSLVSYITYFKSSIKKNTARELRPVNLLDSVNSFTQIISADFKKLNGQIDQIEKNYGVFTTPMHGSEWNSILFNLYTNSKKAIKRAEVDGKIKIILGKDGNSIFLEFNDNGDGIPEQNRDRIFNAFFSTSTPVGYDPLEDGIVPGNGLGLKIVKDILEAYKGEIILKDPEVGYTTSFRLTIPAATPNELNEYEL